MSLMVDPVDTTVVLEADTAQVAVARRFVRRAVGDTVPPDVASDLQLIVSELFTNAVQYGRSGSIEVTVEVTSDAAGVRVDSDGPATSVGPIETWEVADEEEITGRGLGIVRELADVVHVERRDGHFVVSARRVFVPAC